METQNTKIFSNPSLIRKELCSILLAEKRVHNFWEQTGAMEKTLFGFSRWIFLQDKIVGEVEKEECFMKKIVTTKFGSFSLKHQLKNLEFETRKKFRDLSETAD